MSGYLALVTACPDGVAVVSRAVRVPPAWHPGQFHFNAVERYAAQTWAEWAEAQLLIDRAIRAAERERHG